jgi:abhydrolase domain-containing protein 6
VKKMKKTFRIIILILSAVILSGCTSFQKSLFDIGLFVERFRSGMDYKKVTVDGETYAYLEREGEGETIVLLHGFSAEKYNWIRFVRHVPEKYRILAIDMPGHGDCRLDMERDYTVEYLTECVAGVIDALAPEKVHIAGNSLGGLVSTVYALDHPDRVITLGLFDSAGVKSPVRSEFSYMLDRGDNPLLVKSREGFDRLMALNFNTEPFIPWPGRSVLAQKYIDRKDFHQKLWEDLFGNRLDENLNSRLRELQMPVCVIWGEKDRILHVSSTDIYRQFILNAHVAIIKDCGHAPMLERPEEAGENYANFMQRISRN